MYVCYRGYRMDKNFEQRISYTWYIIIGAGSDLMTNREVLDTVLEHNENIIRMLGILKEHQDASIKAKD